MRYTVSTTARVGRADIVVVSLQDVPDGDDGAEPKALESKRPVFVMVSTNGGMKAYNMMGKSVELSDVETLCPGACAHVSASKRG